MEATSNVVPPEPERARKTVLFDVKSEADGQKRVPLSLPDKIVEDLIGEV